MSEEFGWLLGIFSFLLCTSDQVDAVAHLEEGVLPLLKNDLDGLGSGPLCLLPRFLEAGRGCEVRRVYRAGKGIVPLFRLFLGGHFAISVTVAATTTRAFCGSSAARYPGPFLLGVTLAAGFVPRPLCWGNTLLQAWTLLCSCFCLFWLRRTRLPGASELEYLLLVVGAPVLINNAPGDLAPLRLRRRG